MCKRAHARMYLCTCAYLMSAATAIKLTFLCFDFSVVFFLRCAIKYASATGATPDSRSYTLLILGQVTYAFAQCLLFAIPSRLSSTWFGTSERASATAASWASSYIAIALSFLITPPVVEAGGDNGDGLKSMLLVRRRHLSRLKSMHTYIHIPFD